MLYSVLGLLCVPVFRHAALRPETPVGVDTWVLVVLSTLANVIVIAYHYLIPAHPKFLMLPWRRWILRVHIVSGTIELVAGEVKLEPPVDHGLDESQAVDQQNRLVAELPHRDLGVKRRPLRRVDRS